MNYQLLSAILKGTWAIDEQIAESYFPFIQSVLNPSSIVSELSFNEEDYKTYAIDRGTVEYKRWDGGFDKAPKNSIAVIPIHGPLMRQDQACGPVGMETIGKRVKEASSNNNIKGILFVTNSPGGTVDALSELGDIIEAVEKPTLTFTKGMMASAAVYLASYTNKIIAASNRTIVGSVGTMMGYRDISGALEKLGVKDHVIRSSFSPHKNKYDEQIKAGNYTQVQKEILDPLALDFINVVKTNMPGVTKDQVTGETYYAQDVIGSFVDAIGDFDFALAELNTLIDAQNNHENSNIHSNSYAMEKQYANVNTALKVESLESEEAGIYLQEEQIAALDQELGNAQATLDTTTQNLATAEADRDTAQAALQTANENNQRLVQQIRDQGAQVAAGVSKNAESIEGNEDKDPIAEMDHIKEAKAKLENY